MVRNTNKISAKQPGKPRKTGAKKLGFFGQVGKWFRELKSEGKKVVWPTKSQTINNTLVVIGMVLLVGAFIWILDFGFGMLVRFITNLLA